jgi:VWFA-related protein
MKTIGIALLTLIFSGATVAQTPAPAKPPQAQQPQQSQKSTSSDNQTLRVNTTLVNTVFTVADKNGKGKFITNLKQENFKIFEDDKPQAITNFSTETNLPLSIALVVDTSGSIRDKLQLEQEAATEFFYSILHKGKDKGMVISFDSGVDVQQEFTDDPEVLSAAIKKIRAGGGTSLFDAVYLAIAERLSKEADNRRKVIILISDGDDNSSRISQTETLEIAQRYNVIIYCISTNQSAYFGGKDQVRGDNVLKKLSNETGGRPLFPAKVADVSLEFKDIGEELRSQYSIGYVPNRPDDNSFRRLRIEVVSNKNYKARARSGYYSPKPSTSQ